MEKLLRVYWNPYLKIYALSGYIDDFDMNELEHAGFSGIYQKPIRKANLEEILNADLWKLYNTRFHFFS